MDALASGQRVTFDDLEEARQFTAKIVVRSSRSDKSGAMMEDEIIAKAWREVAEWKRKNLPCGRHGWFRW